MKKEDIAAKIILAAAKICIFLALCVLLYKPVVDYVNDYIDKRIATFVPRMVEEAKNSRS